MFNGKKKLRQEIRTLQDKIATQDHAAKLVHESTRDTIRIHKARLDDEYAQKRHALNIVTEERVGEIQDECRASLDARAQTETQTLMTLCSELMDRLPKVTVRQIDAVKRTD